VSADVLLKYLPQYNSNNVPSVRGDHAGSGLEHADREFLFKVLREYRTELNDLRKIVYDMAAAVSGKTESLSAEGVKILNRGEERSSLHNGFTIHQPMHGQKEQVIEVEETLSLQDKEIDMIKKALRKHKGKRKNAARELGISERTLYRKINEYAIED
jgi:DNA-binding NtrC family response regulator